MEVLAAIAVVFLAEWGWQRSADIGGGQARCEAYTTALDHNVVAPGGPCSPYTTGVAPGELAVVHTDGAIGSCFYFSILPAITRRLESIDAGLAFRRELQRAACAAQAGRDAAGRFVPSGGLDGVCMDMANPSTWADQSAIELVSRILNLNIVFLDCQHAPARVYCGVSNDEPPTRARRQDPGALATQWTLTADNAAFYSPEERRQWAEHGRRPMVVVLWLNRTHFVLLSPRDPATGELTYRFSYDSRVASNIRSALARCRRSWW